MAASVVHYFDYKSPYAYLAQEETYALEQELGVEIDWRPYTLDLASFMGAAQLDASGSDVLGTRTAHQWRRVKYSYMDCRREANRRGLIVRGPRKVFDSSIAHIGFLHAKRAGSPRAYHDRVFERFWTHQLDIEDSQAIARELEEAGVDSAGFASYLAGDGRTAHDRIQQEAEASGVFGVPSYLVGDELFWGAERLPRVRELLGAGSND